MSYIESQDALNDSVEAVVPALWLLFLTRLVSLFLYPDMIISSHRACRHLLPPFLMALSLAP